MTSTVLRRQPDPRRNAEVVSGEMHTGLVEARESYIANRPPVEHLIPLKPRDLLTCRRTEKTGFDALDWLYDQPGAQGVEGRETFADFMKRNNSTLSR